MQTGTFLWILLALTAAMLLALYQYAYRGRLPGTLSALLVGLRFLTLAALLILLINPKFTRTSYRIRPPNLVILADNTSSMADSATASATRTLFDQLWRNESLQQRFRPIRLRFGNGMVAADDLDFKENATDISGALKSLNETYGQSPTAVILLTDGNQTLGEDYEFISGNRQLPVYPIALGDTTRYEDIRIEQANSNAYAFLDNQYPIEIFTAYDGPGHITSQLQIAMDGKRVHEEQLELSPSSRSKTIRVLLKATEVGLHTLRISLSPLANERNISNNVRTLAVDVIDEKTDVALVSRVLHPDLGALEKAIESNAQRSVRILKPDAPLSALEASDIFILYQPDPSFKNIYEYLAKSGSGLFTITGPQTDWDYLNGTQSGFQKETMGQSEEFTPTVNPAFSLFDISDLSLDAYPPLEGELGDVLITKPYEVLIGQQVRGVDIHEPLLALMDDPDQKEAVLFGANCWKWRMQSYRDHQDFGNFDNLIGKIILFLANSSTRDRFRLNYPTVMKGSREARIRATYFDKTFVFDAGATILLRIRGKDSGNTREFPMLLGEGYYEADLSELPPGNYTFTAEVKGEEISKSGHFTILDFDVEKQLIATDYRKLGRLAARTGGRLFYPAETSRLVDTLLADQRYMPVRQSEQKVVSLIDFRWLLVLVAASLAGEWFTRKYNGLT